MIFLRFIFFIFCAAAIGLLAFAATRGPVTHLISCNGEESMLVPGDVKKVDNGKHLKFKNVWGQEVIKPTKTCQAHKFETEDEHDVD